MTTLKLVIALIVSVSALDNVELVQTSPSRRVPDDTDNTEPIDADVDTEADKMANSPQNDDGVGNADFDMEDSPSDSQQDNAGLDDEPSASQQNDDGKLDDEPSPGQESSDENLDDPNFDSLLQLTSHQEPKDDVDTEADKLADAPQNDNGALDDEPSASQDSASQSDDGKLDDEPTPGEESNDQVDDPNFDSLLQLSSRQEPKDDVDTEAEKLADAPQKDDDGKLDDEPSPGQESSDENLDDPNFDSLLELTSREEPKDDVDIEADKLADAEQKDNAELDDEPAAESAPQNVDVKLDDEPSASQETDSSLDDLNFDTA